ncbi:hypothetical protein C8Q73DRAFT_665594 [Cubamyces lactineus]|nr:hypothetical protein C8Q73DRAFT_665594 [Cubamyces lactineus]
MNARCARALVSAPKCKKCTKMRENARTLLKLFFLSRISKRALESQNASWFNGKHLVKTTIHRALKKLGLSQKKLCRIAAQRDNTARNEWKQQITSLFCADQLVFADESSKDEQTVLRQYGILPALSLHGILMVRVVPGSIDSVTFYDWVVLDLVRIASLCLTTAGPTKATQSVKRLKQPTPEIGLMEAVMAAVTAEKAHGWYAHVGYLEYA